MHMEIIVNIFLESDRPSTLIYINVNKLLVQKV